MASTPEGATGEASDVTVEQEGTPGFDPADLRQFVGTLPWSLDRTVVFRDGDTFYLARTPVPDAPELSGLGREGYQIDTDEPVVVARPTADGLDVERRDHDAVAFESLTYVPALSDTDGEID